MFKIYYWLGHLGILASVQYKTATYPKLHGDNQLQKGFNCVENKAIVKQSNEPDLGICLIK